MKRESTHLARNLSRILEFGRHCARAIGRQRQAGRCSADAFGRQPMLGLRGGRSNPGAGNPLNAGGGVAATTAKPLAGPVGAIATGSAPGGAQAVSQQSKGSWPLP